MRVATIRSRSTRNTSGGDSCAMTQAKFRLMRTWRNEEEDMKRTTEKMRFLRSRALVLIALLALLGFTVGCSTQPSNTVSADPGGGTAPAKKDAGLLSRILPGPVTIPSGTTLSVRLLQTISSRSAKPGEEFDAELAAPIIVEGKTLFPKSARVRGRVVSAQESGRLQDPGYLRLTLAAIQMESGKWVNVETSSISAKGQGHTKRNLTLIGGGAGTGALIGALAGGGKGAAIGAGVGAGAGTAGAYATGKKEVSFPAESKLAFRTAREVSVSS